MIVLSQIWRKPLVPLFLAFQIAIASAMLVNAAFQGWTNLRALLGPEGIKGEDLVLVDQLANFNRPWQEGEINELLADLSDLSQVKNVTAAYGLPMVTGQIFAMGLGPRGGEKIQVACYLGKDLSDVLGTSLTSGRSFEAQEYIPRGVGGGHPSVHTVLPIEITEELGRRWFGAGNGIGKKLISTDGNVESDFIVVGILKHLVGNKSSVNATDDDQTVILPYSIGATQTFSLAVNLKGKPSPLTIDQIEHAVHVFLIRSGVTEDQSRVETYAERRDDVLSTNRAGAWLFLSIISAVTVVLFVGILGLSRFWISERTKEIGVRRALGARRLDIFLERQVECLTICFPATIIGAVLAVALNARLRAVYELPSLPVSYVLAGSLVVILMCLLGCLSASNRASKISPLDAMRS